MRVVYFYYIEIFQFFFVVVERIIKSLTITLFCMNESTKYNFSFFSK